MKNLYLFAVSQGSGNINIMGTFDANVLSEFELQWQKRTLDVETYAGGDGINCTVVNVPDDISLETLGLREITLRSAKESSIG